MLEQTCTVGDRTGVCEGCLNANFTWMSGNLVCFAQISFDLGSFVVYVIANIFCDD